MIAILQITEEPNAKSTLSIKGVPMTEDARCCGTGTCIINVEGVCWCGQLWDGEKMCFPNAMKSDDLAEDKQIVDIATDRSDSNRINQHQLE